MSLALKEVVSVADLLASAKDPSIEHLLISGELRDVPSFRLHEGQTLSGKDESAALIFVDGSDGLQLSSANAVNEIHLETDPECRAIFNDTSVASLGVIQLTNITAIGQVQILARDQVRSGHVEVNGLHVVHADTRGQTERPQGFGVHVLQGAFTLWNMQSDKSVTISCHLIDLNVGLPSLPVVGSGVFVSGAGFEGGRLTCSLLETGSVYSNGMIPAGTADVISGGVFTVFNAFVDVVRNVGPSTTYGVNDMVLDNWGSVDRWIAEDKVTSYGPSGIGFVNFGFVDTLTVKAPIETFGQGARGFNVYAGTVNKVSFDRITTHGDGSVGVQISQPIGELTVARGIETFGAIGDSLVKGVVIRLAAVAFSVKPGGSAKKVDIQGGVTTHGNGVVPIEMHGAIGLLTIGNGIKAAGEGFDKI
jgi:hypothetical protein